MVELKKMFGSNFCWIDHHAPVIKESFKLKFDDVSGERNTFKSALLNAYKYYYDPFDIDYNEGKCPEILRILSAYDSWSYEREGYTLDYVMAVNKAVTYTFNEDGERKQFIENLGTICSPYKDSLEIKIENELYGFDYINDEIKKRVARLEKTIYGKEGSGNIDNRIKKLSADILPARKTNAFEKQLAE